MATREVLAVACALALIGCAGTVSGEADRSDRLAAAILASQSREELVRRLDQGGIVPADSYLQIPMVLFERIAARNDRPEHWAALCQVDVWADGAWHLEMKGAAFDALARNPGGFAEHYVEGDDCALLLLTYAYGWALQAADVQGVDCTDGGQREIQEYQKVVDAAEQAILGYEVAPSGPSVIRRGVLLEIVWWTKDAWAAARTRLESGCREAPDDDAI